MAAAPRSGVWPPPPPPPQEPESSEQQQQSSAVLNPTNYNHAALGSPTSPASPTTPSAAAGVKKPPPPPPAARGETPAVTPQASPSSYTSARPTSLTIASTPATPTSAAASAAAPAPGSTPTTPKTFTPLYSPAGGQRRSATGTVLGPALSRATDLHQRSESMAVNPSRPAGAAAAQQQHHHHSASFNPVSSSPAASSPDDHNPALTAIKQELNEVLDVGHATFSGMREFKAGSKDLRKLDPDGRLTGMVNRLWYRFAYLVNAKYPGTGSPLMKEAILVLTVLAEVRQTVMDVFEFSKAQGDKVSVILQRHAWIWDTTKRLEALASILLDKIASSTAKDRGASATTYIPQLLDAPLALFEDRLSNFTAAQQATLFEECSNLKSLRQTVEKYMSMDYEVSLIALCITEAIGKALHKLLTHKENRKLYAAALSSAFSVGRANSWMLMKSQHSVDLAKTGANKLSVQTAPQAAAAMNSPSSASSPATPGRHSVAGLPPGHASVNAADLLRQNAQQGTSRSLPNEESLRNMMAGQVLTGYFLVPSLDEPIMQRMFVWYDILDGTAEGDPLAAVGKKGALYWVPEKTPKLKSEELCLPIADITDILLGKQTKIFSTAVGAKANPACCVTLVSRGGYSLNFEAASKEALTAFMAGLTRLANASGKKMSEQEETPRAARRRGRTNTNTGTMTEEELAALGVGGPDAVASPRADEALSSPTRPAAASVAAPAQTQAPSTPSSSTAGTAGTRTPSVLTPLATPAATPAATPSTATRSVAANEGNVATSAQPAAQAETVVPAQTAPVAATPAVAAAQPAAAAAVVVSPVAAPVVNGGWIRCTAPDGNHYYYSPSTKTSVWIKPAEFIDP